MDNAKIVEHRFFVDSILEQNCAQLASYLESKYKIVIINNNNSLSSQYYMLKWSVTHLKGHSLISSRRFAMAEITGRGYVK